MENFIAIMALLSFGNTLVTQFFKWLFKLGGIVVSGAWASIMSWATPVVATYVMWTMGMLGTANWFGMLVFAILSALTSNQVYDVVKGSK